MAVLPLNTVTVPVGAGLNPAAMPLTFTSTDAPALAICGLPPNVTVWPAELRRLMAIVGITGARPDALTVNDIARDTLFSRKSCASSTTVYEPFARTGWSAKKPPSEAWAATLTDLRGEPVVVDPAKYLSVPTDVSQFAAESSSVPASDLWSPNPPDNVPTMTAEDTDSEAEGVMNVATGGVVSVLIVTALE